MEETHTAYPLITINGVRNSRDDRRNSSEDRRISRFASLNHGIPDSDLRDRGRPLHRPRTYSQLSFNSNPDEFDIRPDSQVLEAVNPAARPAFPPPRNSAGNRGAYAPLRGLTELWRPFWLRASVLVGFVFLFAALLVSVVLLQYYADENDGYSIKSTSPFAWTYGPTAVLVIVIGLWRQIDYYCKLLAPWAELRRRRVSAADSLLLDYFTPFQLLSLGRAVAHGHVAVVATVLGFIILTITTIFATGLFVLVPTVIMDPNFPLNTTTKFDSARASPYTVSSSSFESGAISNAPVYAYYGNLAHGLPLTPGVEKEFAYATFDGHSQVPANATVIAEVDAFVPKTNCSAVHAQIDGPTSVVQSNQTGTFNTSLSLLLPDGFVCENWSVVQVPVQDPATDLVPAKQISGTMQPVYCLNQNQVDFSKGPDAYLFTLTDVRYAQTLFANASLLTDGVDTIANETSMSLSSMTNVLCQPSYTITRMNITNSTTASNHGGMNVTTVPSQNTVNRTLDGLSPWNLTSVFVALIDASSSLYNSSTIPLNTNIQVPNTLFSLLALHYNSTDYQILFDSSKLMSAIGTTFDGITAQFAHQNLMSPSHDAMNGVAIYMQHRLRIQPVSYYIMITGFALMIVMTVLVFFLGPRAVVSRDPSSLGTIAAILAQSHDLNNELRAHVPGNSIPSQTALQGKTFRTSAVAADTGSGVFKLEAEDDPSLASRITSEHTAPTKWRWWHPVSLSIPSIVLTLAVPVGLIIALELLQRHSNHHQGLMNMSDDRYDAAYIHYIPALIMLLVASLFITLEFNMAMFAPFAALKRGNATARRTLASHLLGKWTPFALFEAIRCRHIGAFFSIVGAVAASALTIIVSGLYSVQVMNFPGPTRDLTRLDSFNTNWTNSYGQDNGAAATFSLIAHMNMSYPDFTYDELAFSQFSIGDFNEQPNDMSLITGPDTATIPALRGNLDCTVLPVSSFNVSTQPAGPFTYSFDTAIVTVRFDMPANCQIAGYWGNDSVATYTNIFKLNPNSEDTYAGAQLDLLFGNDTSGVNFGEIDNSPVPDNPPGCPSLAFTFGQFKLKSTDVTNVTTMVCYQQIQQVSANATFIVNSTTIDTRHSPTVNESSAKLLINPLSTTGQTSYQFRLQQNLANEVAMFTGSGYSTIPGGINNVSTMDVFYQAVTNGTDKTLPADLVGAAGQPRLINATNHFYRKYLAQAIHANMRQPCTGNSCTTKSPTTSALSTRQASSNSLSPMAITVSIPRLIQSSSSKLALQILLAVTVVTTILAITLIQPHSILPQPPTSIYGTMSLLAGSELCRSPSDDTNLPDQEPDEMDHHMLLPPGAEFLNKTDMSARFAGMRLSIGFWHVSSRKGKEREGHQRKRRFGVDVGRADGLDDQEWALNPLRGASLRQNRGSRLDRLPGFLQGPLREEQPEPAERTTSRDRTSRLERLPPWLQGPLRQDEGAEAATGPATAPAPGPAPGPGPPLGPPPATTPPAHSPRGDAAATQGQESPQRPSRLSKLPGWLQGPLRESFEGLDRGDGRGEYQPAPAMSPGMPPALASGVPGGPASAGEGGNTGLRIRGIDEYRHGPGA